MTDEDSDLTDSVRSLADDVGVDSDFAAELYDKNIDPGDGYVEHGVPAAVYAAVRVKGVPSTPDEVADAAGVETGRLLQDTKRLVGSLPVSFDVGATTTGFIDRFADDVDVPEVTRQTAHGVADAAVAAGYDSGRTARVIAATALYAAVYLNHDDVTQAEVCDTADVSTVIVRRYYKDFAAEYSGVDVDDDDRRVEVLVDEIIDALGFLSSDTIADAKSIAANLDTDDSTFRRSEPKSIAAAVVYVSASRRRDVVSQAEVGDVVGASRHAVSSRVKDVRDWCDSDANVTTAGSE